MRGFEDLPEIAPAPDWLINLATTKPRQEPRQEAHDRPGCGLGDDCTPYGRAALERELGILASTPDGQKNVQLNTSAFALGQLIESGDIPETVAVENLSRVALRIALETVETQRTIRSGIEAGMNSPRAPRDSGPAPTRGGDPGPGHFQNFPGDPGPAGGPVPGDPGMAGKREGIVLTDWISTKVFVGKAPAREYLIDSMFPRGQVSLLGASGGVGKSFGLTAMCRDFADHDRNPFTFHFGGALLADGRAVYLSGEDDEIEAHSRIEALGGPLDDLIFVPFASAGGAPAFFRSHPVTREPVPTQDWLSIRNQVVAMNAAVVVIDPLQVFCTLDLNQPENAQFVCSQLSALAAETRAAVIISHHFRKGGVSSPETAREAIRGTAGLVDGVRAVYALWTPTGDSRERGNPKAICRKLHVQYAPGKIINGAIVKANGKADTKVYTFMREDDGRLLDVTNRLGWLAELNLDGMLSEAIARAATEGKPYTKTGQTGLWERRAEMDDPFHHFSKHKFTELVEQLLQEKKVVAASAKGSPSVKWLDVPGGVFASGNGEFVPGHISPKSRV